MRRVLILNASHNDERMIKALKELNFYVISTGNNPSLPGHKLCDEYIPLDYSNKEAVLELAKSLKIDRICACCNDFGVLTAAYVAEKLHIPGYDSYETTLTLHNKDRFKSFAKQYGIITPDAEQFTDPQKAKAYAETVKYPVVVKAVDLSAGNGIRKADNYKEAIEAIDNAFLCSRIKHIVIEPYIFGKQHGFSSFLINRKVVGYCSNNEYSFINPYRVEIDTFPADDENIVAGIIISQIERIADVLHLADGCFHLQYITDEYGKPHIIECMRRIAGGLYTIPGESVSGINWDYWEVRAKCTDSLIDFPVFQHNNKGFFSYKCIMANRNGKIKNILVSDEIMRHRYGEWWLKQIGEEINDYRVTPIGYVFSAFDTEEEMYDILINKYYDSIVEVDNNN